LGPFSRALLAGWILRHAGLLRLGLASLEERESVDTAAAAGRPGTATLADKR